MRILLFTFPLKVKMTYLFCRYGRLGDVYRPMDKNTMKKCLFVFVRFIFREDMFAAFSALQGKVIEGRPMILTIATSGYELDTQVY